MRGLGKRDDVCLAALHVFGGDRPEPFLKIEFLPCRESSFLRTGAGQYEQIERETSEGWLTPQGGQERWDGDIGHRLSILGFLDLPRQAPSRFQTAIARGCVVRFLPLRTH